MELFQMTLNLSHALARFLKDLFRRFNRPQATSLRAEEWQDQRDLTLLIGPDARDLYSKHYPGKLESGSSLLLSGRTVSLSDVDSLLQLMPHIGRLHLVLPRIHAEEISAIVALLRGWSGSLRNLAVFIRQSVKPYTSPSAVVSEQLLRLLAAINCLSQLGKLTFHLEGFLLPVDALEWPLYPQSLYLPILEQLESFYFSSRDKASILTDSLAHYVRSNDRPVRLNILNMADKETFKCLLQMGPWVADSLATFISGWPLTAHQLDRLCSTFRGIRKLLIPVNGRQYSLPRVGHLLRPLKHLRTLILMFSTIQLEMNAIQGYLGQVDPEKEPLLDALRQVTRLEANFSDVRNHQQLDALCLHRFFPKIKELFISSAATECTICGVFGSFQGRQDRLEDEARAEACCQAMEAQMRARFPFLQEVQVSFYG